MNEEFRIEERVSLKNGVMIIGLSGWANAGEVSTFAVRYLADKLGARKLGEVLPDRFHDYLIERPIVKIEDGTIKSYIPPTNDIFYCKRQEEGSGFILLLGHEPHLNWPRYADTILELAETTGVSRIYTIGGYLADIPDEGETLVTGSANNDALAAELQKVGVILTNYEGPTSVYSEISWKGKERNASVMSLWCPVPLYVRGLYPKSAYAMLKKVLQLAKIEIDLKDLKEKAEQFRAQLEKDAMEQPELRDLIESLRRRHAEKEPTYIF